MEKIKTFILANKTPLLIAATILAFCSLSMVSAVAIFLSKGPELQSNEGEVAEEVDEAQEGDSEDEVTEVDPGGSEDPSDEIEPRRLNEKELEIVNKILSGLDKIATKGTVGFDFFVTDGDEWSFAADVKQDFNKDSLFVDVTQDNVSMGYYCSSDCKRVYVVQDSCEYYLGNGYEAANDIDGNPDETFLYDQLAKTCSSLPFQFTDIEPSFLEWGVSVDDGDIYKEQVYGFTSTRKETKTIDGESMTVYTIIDGPDDSSDDGWPKDIVAAFDKNGMLRLLEYGFNYGYRTISFNEFGKVYNISFP